MQWLIVCALGAVSAWGAASWPMHRGNPQLNGVSPEVLPDALALLWKIKTGGPVKSSAAIVDGRVYVGSDDGHVYALNLADGGKIWTHKTADPIEASPLVLDGLVIVGGLDGVVYALDIATGKPRWQVKTGDKIVGGANTVKSPDGKSNWVLVGSHDYTLYCLEAKTGKVVWKYMAENFINGSPAVTQGRTMFGGCDALLHVIDLAKGEREKAIEAGAYIASSAAADGQFVYVGHYENEFLCFDIKEGRVVWKYRDRQFPYSSSPAVTKDRVLFGGHDKRLHCLDRAKGEAVWVFNTRGQINSSPVVCGKRVLIGSNDGRLYMVSMADGTRVWDYETQDAITASPAVAEGRVVIGSEDGHVYCFGAKKP